MNTMVTSPRQLSDAAAQAFWWLQHNISDHQFAPLSLTVTAYQLGCDRDETDKLLTELTEAGYLRHLQTEVPSTNAPGSDIQHYQLTDKIPQHSGQER